MSEAKLAEILHDLFQLKDSVSLNNPHTVMGQFPWQWSRVRNAEQLGTGDWGAIFVLDPDRFAGEYERQFRDRMPQHLSILGDGERLDIFRRGANWQQTHWTAEGLIPKKAHAVTPQLKRRFHYFYKLQEKDTYNHLKFLESKTELMIYSENGAQRFWTFNRKDEAAS